MGKKAIVFCGGNKGGANFQVGLQKRHLCNTVLVFLIYTGYSLCRLATLCIVLYVCGE